LREGKQIRPRGSMEGVWSEEKKSIQRNHLTIEVDSIVENITRGEIGRKKPGRAPVNPNNQYALERTATLGRSRGFPGKKEGPHREWRRLKLKKNMKRNGTPKKSLDPGCRKRTGANRREKKGQDRGRTRAQRRERNDDKES